MMEGNVTIIDSICQMAMENEVLDQLQEECAELIKAASKNKRVMRQDKNVDAEKARKNLIEELADVQVMCEVVMAKMLSKEECAEVHSVFIEKVARYHDRLIKR